MDQHEALINQKLEQLTRQIDQPDQPVTTKTSSSEGSLIPASGTPITEDVDRLEKMMQIMSSTDTNDPEMQQIESMLDKILDVQHPERVREKIREQSSQHKEQIFPVEAVVTDDNISTLGEYQRSSGRSIIPDSVHSSRSYTIESVQNGFFGLADEELANEESANAIQAVIHDTQTVVAGSTVKLRLLSDIFINGQLVEKDQFVFGTCAISGERLTISITSIRDANSLLPVSLSVFDLDGLEGIYIPGAITRDAAKQASSQSIQDVQLYSMDNSLGVQAATAGIEAAKGLFAKKAKLIKVTVKAGYQVLLQDKNQSVQ